MKSVKIGMLVLMSLLLMVSCGQEGEAAKKGEGETADRARVYPVKVHVVEVDTIPRTLDYTANLTAFKEIDYAPASPGRIGKIYVEANDRIKTGQILVEMDNTQLRQSKTQYESAKTNYMRIDTLHDLGSISEQQYDQALTQYELAKANYGYLKENTQLLSPIDGIVTDTYYENGEVYTGAPNPLTGVSAVVSVMQINPMKAEVGISQKYFPDIKKGMKAKVSTDIYKGEAFNGYVNKVYPTINPNTRTFRVEVLIKNDSEKLRPGMFANISIKLDEVEALVVPAIAVLKQEGTNNRYVFLYKDSIANKVGVEIGRRFDDKIEISSENISMGDMLIVEGQASLLDSSRVRLVGE